LANAKIYNPATGTLSPAGYQPGFTTTANFTILPYTASQVSFSQSATTIQPGSTATFTVSRTGSLTNPLTVNYTTSGTATNGTDYNYLDGSVVIPAGQSSATVTITVPQRSGGTAIPQETITITPQASTLSPVAYEVASGQQPLNYTIPPYSPSTVTITTPDTQLTPGETGLFTLTRAGGDNSQVLPVNLTLGGSAQNGTDYSLPTVVTIPAGQNSASFSFATTPQNGTTATPQKSLNVSLATGGYAVGTSNNAIAYTILAYNPAALSVAASGGGTINRGSSGSFTISRTGATTSALAINYALGGTAVNGTDYTAPTNGVATIPAGQSSVTVPVSVPAATGNQPIPAQNVILSIQSGSSYAVPASPNNQATLTIPAYTPATVSIAPVGGNTTLASGATTGFTITRTGPTTQSLSVPYTLSGTAQSGTDYVAIPNTVTIPAGQASATVPLTAIAPNGSTAQPAKALTVTVPDGTNFTAVSGSNAVSYSIPAYNPNGLSLTPSGGGTINPGGSGSFTITRSGSTTNALSVNYTLGGSAVNGTDYSALSTGVATIPAGQSSVTLPVNAFPVSGTQAVPAKDIIFAIQSGNGYSVPTSPGNQASLTISAYTPASVSITPVGGNTTLTSGSAAGFVIARTGPTTQSLSVPYTLSGTAQSGTDYTPIPNTVTIPAGQSSAIVPLTAIAPNGSTPQPAKALTVTVPDGTNYAAASGSNVVTYSIPAYNPNGLSLTPSGGGTINPGTSGGFTITRSGDTSNALPVNYTLGGSASNGTDYTAPASGIATIPAGQASVMVPVSVPVATGSQPIAQKDITFAIQPGNGYAAPTAPANQTTLTIPAYTPAAVSISAGGGNTTLSSGSNTSFVIARTGPTTQALSVPYTLGGTAQPGTDFVPISNAVTIAAGQSSVTVPLTAIAPNGSTAQPAKTLTVTVPNGNGYTAQPGSNSVSYTIPAYNPSTLSISTSGNGTINRGSSGGFIVDRGSNTSQPVTVNYTLGGTATPGTDYTAPTTGTLTIPAGQSSGTIPVSVPAANSNQPKPAQSIVLTVQPGSGYSLGNPAPTSTLTIPAYSPGTVAIAPIGGNTTLSGSNVGFTITRTGDTSQPLSVPYTLSGTAQSGTDYTPIPNTVTIPAGQSSATVPLTAIAPNGSAAQPAKTLTVTVPDGTNYTAQAGNNTVSYSIPAYNPNGLSLTPSGGGAINRGSSGGFTITRSGSTTAALPVNYTLGGSAVNGTDYTAPTSGIATIPAGQSSVSIPVSVPTATSNQALPSQSITLSIQPGNGYSAPTSPGNQASLTISAYTPNTVSIAPMGGNTTLTSGASTGFTVTRTGPTTQALSVPYTLSGTAQSGTDYVAIPNTVTIPVGQSSATVPLTAIAPNGSAAQPAKALTVTIPNGTNYTAISGSDVVTYSIPAYNPNGLSLTPSGGGSINRGSSGSFTITRSGDTSNALPVNYTLGGSAQNGPDYTAPTSGIATIPAGQSSVSIPVSVPTATGSQPIAQKDIVFAIQPGNGYTAPTAPDNQTSLTIPAYTPAAVSISAGGGNTTLSSGSNTSFVIARTGPTTQVLSVPYTLTGTAQPGTDFVPIPNTVTIAAGQSSVTVPLTAIAPNGSTAQPAKTLTVTVPDGASYTAQAGGNTVSYTIPAYSPNGLSITPSNGGTINRGSSGAFTVTRSGDTSQLATINYSLGGAAANGSDYTAPTTGTLTIPAGQSSGTIPVNVPAENGSSAKPSKDIVLALQPGNGYSVPASPANQSTLTIPAYNPAGITVTPSNGGTVTPGTTGTFTVTRSGDTSQPLPINYNLGGSAQPGSDYTGPGASGTITIPAGQTTATLPVSVPAANGSTAQSPKTITFTPTAGNGYDSSAIAPATLTIPAYSPSTVTFSNPGGALTPGGTSDAATITRTGDTSQPLIVSYTTSGSAQPGTDYAPLPGVAVIPAGQTTATIPLRANPQSGTTAQPAKNLVLTLQPGNGYAPGSASSGTYTIPAYTPTATPQVTVSVPGGGSTTLNPGQTGTVTFTRTGDTSQPLPVNYTVGGSAQPGSDYNALPGTATIPAGQSTATVPVAIPSTIPTTSDKKTVKIDLANGTGYTSGTNSGTTFTINVPPVTSNTLTATLDDSNADPLITVQRSGDTTSDVTIPYFAGGSAIAGEDYEALPGSITIPAGQSSATIPLNILSSATANRSLVVAFNPPAGYQMANPFVQYTIDGSNKIEVPTPNPSPSPSPTPSPTPINGQWQQGQQPGTIQFTVTRPTNSDLSKPITLTYKVVGDAQPGIDYTQPPGSVTIPAGQTSGRIIIDVLPTARPGKSIGIQIDDTPTDGITVTSPNPSSHTLTQSEIPITLNRPNRPTIPPDNSNQTPGNNNSSDTNANRSSGGSIGAPAILGGLGAAALPFILGSGAGAGASCPPQPVPPSIMSLVPESAIVQSAQPATPAPAGSSDALPAPRQTGPSIDWSKVTFASLKPINGQPAEQSLTLGDVSALGDLKLADLQRMQGGNATLPSLSTTGWFSDTTLKGMAVLYGDRPLNKIPGLWDWLQQQPQLTGLNLSNEAKTALSGMSLTKALEQYPALAAINLGALPLNQVPGLMDTKLKELPNWEKLTIARIPGLAQVPFSQLLPCLRSNAAPPSSPSPTPAPTSSAPTPSASNASASASVQISTQDLMRVRNLARQAAEQANGGLSRYRASSAAYGPSSQLDIKDNGNSWSIRVLGGAPGAATPTQETVVNIPKTFTNISVEYNGAIRTQP
jgi:hypothetical protein